MRGAPALFLLGAAACVPAERSGPAAHAEAGPACVRVAAAEARAFRGLEPMGIVGDAALFGRAGEMLCSEPGAGGAGECEIVGRSAIRIETPGGTYGFRTSGAVPVIFRYAPGRFGCEARGADQAYDDRH